MPKISKVKIEDLVAASRKYVEGQVKKTDVNSNKYLSQTEAKKLAADLQDNFEQSGFKLGTGSVKTADFVREFTVMVEAWAKASDKNGDGYLSITETSALPKNLRDNVINYIEAQNHTQVSSGTLTTRDTTPKARIQEHLAAFGSSAVGYDQAFAIALKAAATDENGLSYFVSEYGGPNGEPIDDPKQIAAEVKTLLANGSMELIPTDEEIPTGEENKDAWIFSVRTDGQGDNGIWAIVDRKTGEAFVSNFN